MSRLETGMMSVEEWCGAPSGALRDFVGRLREEHEKNGGAPLMLRDDVRRVFRKYVLLQPPESRRRLRATLGQRIALTEEVIFHGGVACIVMREDAGKRRAYRTAPNGDAVKLLNERQYLGLRESIILGKPVSEHFLFGIDFRPFRIFPTEAGTTSDIGNGLVRVAGLVEKEIGADPQRALRSLVDFLSGRQAGGRPILFTAPPSDVPSLRTRLRRALALLDGRPADEDIAEVQPELSLLGFAPGWGRTAGLAGRSLGLLDSVLREPEGGRMRELFQLLPLVRSVVLISVHGWFAQADVLGRPDTGGQVVYVLDQARALEAHLATRFREAGVDAVPTVLVLTRQIPEAEGTTCGEPREKILGSENAWILRVPFRHREGGDLRHWVSRFQVWPYLGRFAEQSFGVVMEELGGEAPDLVVGNYSDGAMVASVLGREWNVPIAVVAHALEKTKYLLSDLYWRDLEENYHFSIHFLSDILATMSADFIITSSYQEIAGTEGEMGQYESYELFTLPGRYRVLSGVNIQSARFVINPPGVDTGIYCPANERRAGDEEAEARIAELVFGDPGEDDIRGRFADPNKPLIFTMARMDRIKNLTGLVQTYAKRRELREAANLLVLSGVSRREDSDDHEEREQIGKMHRLFDQHKLEANVRWLPGRLGQKLVPHYYRFVAARRGVFVQPALFEAFGLTVIESMASGLPVVATRFGGPASIVEDGISGFLVDPNRAVDLEKAVLAILRGTTAEGGDVWTQMSRAAMHRVREHFSWEAHARTMIGAYGVYGLWNEIFPKRRAVRRTYVDALYNLLYGRLVEETWPEE